jgi:2-hydroxy-palmitic acid dioxygenase Mpo1-like
VLAALATAAWQGSAWPLLAVPLLAVGPCWLGHVLFEGNLPTAWTRPQATLVGSAARWCGVPGAAARASGGRRWDRPGDRPWDSLAADLRMCAGMGRELLGVLRRVRRG